MNPRAGASRRTLAKKKRASWERRLVSMADAGLDPRDDEQPFRAELNQYLAYTYLRFKEARHKPADLKGHGDPPDSE